MIVDNKFFAHNGILVGNGNRVLGSFDVQYDVTVSSAGNGTASADKNRGHYGDIINLTNTPASHYAFDHYTINGTSTTNSSFALQTDTNVVAYFSRTPDYTDWYFDDQYDTAKVQNRTITSSLGVYAHQKYTANPNPAYNQRQSWSNYGVCRCYWSGYIGRRNDYPSGIKYTIDAIAGYSNEDIFRWRAKDYYPVETTVSNVKVALVINFNTKKANVYTDDNLSFTQDLVMQANGVFLGAGTSEYLSSYNTTLSSLSMKIFEDEADALAFARFE